MTHWIYDEIHPDYIDHIWVNQLCDVEPVVLRRNFPAGWYHGKYGKGADCDIDAVWADREAYQDRLEAARRTAQ